MSTLGRVERLAVMAALAVGCVALVAALIFWVSSGEGAALPASTERDSQTSDEFSSGALDATDVVDRSVIPDCRRRVLATEIVPRGKLADELDAGALEFGVVRPASRGIQGGAALAVNSTFRFSCDGTTGVIGYRGGFRLARDGRFVDFRRLRIDADRNLIRMFADSVTQSGYDGLSCDLDLASVEEVDGKVITTIPLLLTGEGTVAMNVGLGFGSRFTEGDVVGDIVLEMETIA